MYLDKNLLAALLIASIVSVVFIGLVSAESVTDNRPDHVSCSYQESTLEDYRPNLIVSHLESEPSTIYAQYCTSSERSEDVAIYWAYYPVQVGFSSEDSHDVDREPVYVFIDSSSGDVNRIVYSEFHYIKGVEESPNLVDDNNPILYVESPHHSYNSSDGSGSYIGLSDFSNVHQGWHDNDWGADIEVTADPYEIDSRDSFWDDDNAVWDFRVAEWYWEIRMMIANLF